MFHPLLELLINPFAGPAGFNLVAAGVWITLAALIIATIKES